MDDLLSKKCVPCEGGIPPLHEAQVARLLHQLSGWQVEGDKKIWKEFSFKHFMAAVDFINRIALVAEEENHHPNLLLHNYKKLRVELSTHAIGGLSENDFIMAAKIDQLK